MAEDWFIDLYELLPSFYKLKDAEQSYKLRSLLNIISEQADLLKRDIDGLWDDFFIETCNDWVVPYIADLVGTKVLHQAPISGKADVAKTIYYRRRKGTLPMLEELARDVTGWGAHCVAFMELLGWTQNLNHLRYIESPDPSKENPFSVDNVGTANLRNKDALDLLDGPFDVISHTADIRDISRIKGWYGIKKLGFFLWRLNSYPAGIVGSLERSLEDDLVQPRRSSTCSYGYHFNVLGIPCPLFNKPEAETDEAGLASELNVPGPIRALSFQLRPEDYYGREKSLFIVKGGAPVPLAAISPQDLTQWKRPPATGLNVRGLMSADISAFTALTSANPEIGVTIGPGPVRTSVLPFNPVNLDGARASLELALRKAGDSCVYSDAKVLIAGTRLLVLSGSLQDNLSFTPTPADTTTVLELGLDDLAAQQFEATLSGELWPFPELTSEKPEMNFTVGDIGPIRVALKSRPKSLKEARYLLEAAINDAAQSAGLFPVSVEILGYRLLVIAGKEAASFSGTDADSTTFLELALGGNKVAIDVRLGRFAFAEGDEPKGAIGVYHNYGFSADLGGGPYERRMAIETPDPSEVDAGECYVADTLARDLQTTLNDWARSGRPKALVTITDNGTCESAVSLEIGKDRSLVIQAANQRRPSFRPPEPGLIEVRGIEGSCLKLNGLLIEGGLHIDGCLDRLELLHCTLVPGRRLGEDGLAVQPVEPSLLVEKTCSRLSLIMDYSICGAMRLPAEMDGMEIRDSIVDCAARTKGTSRQVHALVSGMVEALSDLGTPLEVAVTIGTEGPFRVELQSRPADLEEAASLLEEAIRGASSSEIISAVRVVAAGNRLMLLSEGGRMIVEASERDPVTAGVLKLVSDVSAAAMALLSDELPADITLSNSSPGMIAVLGSSGPRKLILDPPLRSLHDVRERLQAALNASDEKAFNEAIVAIVENRLVVVSGEKGASAFFAATEEDKTTITELGLQGDWPAIASINDTYQPGPRLSLERTTVLGSIRVRELLLASECIITGQALVDRRQTGCVRFSYVPVESRTPRCYWCQPDLALSELEEEYRKRSESPGSEERQRAIDAVMPAFTSLRFGQPAYAQLSQNCAEEIRTGAEDGSEMGAFSSLKQPQREANLRISLEEYMPFGLDCGFIFIT